MVLVRVEEEEEKNLSFLSQLRTSKTAASDMRLSATALKRSSRAAATASTCGERTSCSSSSSSSSSPSSPSFIADTAFSSSARRLRAAALAPTCDLSGVLGGGRGRTTAVVDDDDDVEGSAADAAAEARGPGAEGSGEGAGAAASAAAFAASTLGPLRRSGDLIRALFPIQRLHLSRRLVGALPKRQTTRRTRERERERERGRESLREEKPRKIRFSFARGDLSRLAKKKK